MNNESLWQSSKPPRYPALKKSGKFDVVVVGGGITGVTTAYLLKQAGKKVCLLERHRLGFVDTGHTTAHLTYVTDLRLNDLVKTFGDDAASLVWEAGSVAIDTIESIVTKEQIECDFRRVPGYYHAALEGTKNESEVLQRDATLAQRLGFPAKYVPAVPYLLKPGILFPNQAKFHPLKYLAALAKLIDGDGSAIYEQSDVEEVKDDPQRVVVGKHEIECDYVVIATHVPLTGKTGLVNAALFQTKIFPYSSYVVGAKVPCGLLPEACFWDSQEPYHYLRVESGKKNDYVIFGGEDHKTGQAENTHECFDRLTATLLKAIPQAQPDRQWSGQVVETNDGLPYIGETAPRQFVATGFAGNGMTFGTVAALMARDAVQGEGNPWQKLFSVNRKKVRGGTWDYLTENLDYPFYYVKDRLSNAEGKSIREVQPGEGKILDLNGERVACSRDDEGQLTKLSPYCTHMGCIVRWNRAEKTWDCPCHGSRFKATGEVLGGPAETPLEALKKQPAEKSPKPSSANTEQPSSSGAKTKKRTPNK